VFSGCAQHADVDDQQYELDYMLEQERCFIKRLLFRARFC
jgi:hypothetical protein